VISGVKKRIQPNFPDPTQFIRVGDVDPDTKGMKEFPRLFQRNGVENAFLTYPGNHINYTVSQKSLDSLANSVDEFNHSELQKVYPKFTGKVLNVAWENKNTSSDKIGIALEAKKMWEDQILPTLENGTIIKNSPVGAEGGARDRAYQRMGFSPVGFNGAQFSIVENGQLVPLNIMKFNHRYYARAEFRRYRDNPKNQKLSDETIKAQVDQRLIERYGDWRNVR
jgi:hypothetical protein